MLGRKSGGLKRLPEVRERLDVPDRGLVEVLVELLVAVPQLGVPFARGGREIRHQTYRVNGNNRKSSPPPEIIFSSV